MRKYLLAPLLLLSLSAAALLGGPAIRASREGPYYRDTVIKLDARDAGKDAQFLWDVDGPAPSYFEAGSSLYLAGPPGNYRVTLTAVDFTAKTITRARFAIVIVEKAPPPPPPPAVQVIVTPRTASVAAGGTLQLAAQVVGSDNQSVLWSCSGAGVVSQAGLFTAGKDAGTATVTATSLAEAGATSSAVLTVTAGPPSPPAPIPLPGLRVLIVYETAERGKMPREQDAILTSTTRRRAPGRRGGCSTRTPMCPAWPPTGRPP